MNSRIALDRLWRNRFAEPLPHAATVGIARDILLFAGVPAERIDAATGGSGRAPTAAFAPEDVLKRKKAGR